MKRLFGLSSFMLIVIILGSLSFPRNSYDNDGYREVSLNSSGISLDVITNQTYTGSRLDVYLIIRNDNPYPVKVPVYQNFTISTLPIEKQQNTVCVGWINTHFMVGANSFEITWHDIKYLRPPEFSIFYMVDGVRASISMGVPP